MDGRTAVSDPTTSLTSEVHMSVQKACYISRVIRRHLVDIQGVSLIFSHLVFGVFNP